MTLPLSNGLLDPSFNRISVKTQLSHHHLTVHKPYFTPPTIKRTVKLPQLRHRLLQHTNSHLLFFFTKQRQTPSSYHQADTCPTAHQVLLSNLITFFSSRIAPILLHPPGSSWTTTTTSQQQKNTNSTKESSIKTKTNRPSRNLSYNVHDQEPRKGHLWRWQQTGHCQHRPGPTLHCAPRQSQRLQRVHVSSFIPFSLIFITITVSFVFVSSRLVSAHRAVLTMLVSDSKIRSLVSAAPRRPTTTNS